MSDSVRDLCVLTSKEKLSSHFQPPFFVSHKSCHINFTLHLTWGGGGRGVFHRPGINEHFCCSGLKHSSGLSVPVGPTYWAVMLESAEAHFGVTSWEQWEGVWGGMVVLEGGEGGGSGVEGSCSLNMRWPYTVTLPDFSCSSVITDVTISS